MTNSHNFDLSSLILTSMLLPHILHCTAHYLCNWYPYCKKINCAMYCSTVKCVRMWILWLPTYTDYTYTETIHLLAMFPILTEYRIYSKSSLPIIDPKIGVMCKTYVRARERQQANSKLNRLLIKINYNFNRQF